MSSIRNVEQTSIKSKVLHIGLGIILATSLLPIAPNQLFADEVTNNKATTFTDQVTEATKTSQTYQVVLDADVAFINGGGMTMFEDSNVLIKD